MPERLRCFVIMPYSETSDEVFSGTIRTAVEHTVPEVLVFRADEMPVALTLKAHVENAVQSADFCIVDLTGANPNVMYELGYATAQQKPIVLIQEAHSGRSLPSDLQGMLILKYDRQRLGEFRAELSRGIEHVAKIVESRRMETRHVGGTLSADLLNEPAVLDRFAASVRYSLSAMVNSPRVLLEVILPRLNLGSYPELLVRVVCADPEGESARARAHHLGVPISSYRAEVWAQLRALRKFLVERCKPRAEVRLTTEMIPTSLLLGDDVALVFPYLYRMSSRGAVGIDIVKERSPMLFDIFRQQFGIAWNQAAPGFSDAADLLRGIDDGGITHGEVEG